jgi:hypothetical protein
LTFNRNKISDKIKINISEKISKGGAQGGLEGRLKGRRACVLAPPLKNLSNIHLFSIENVSSLL